MPVSTKPLRVWLGLCCFMIFVMAVIGAITRLTESGLSITRWDVLAGTLPPLNNAQWQQAFQLYQATPQYHAINQGMSLEDFKGIFLWEWAHRLWGRLIGLVYALPLLFFWLRGHIPSGFKASLFLGLLLGGLQGVVGWIMVQSGLQPGMTAVSHYRLALHLVFALGLYSFLLWQIMRLSALPAAPMPMRSFCFRRHSLFAMFFLILTIIWGAFTAGLDAGKIYNSFPLMNGHIFPEDGLAQSPTWLNFLANPAAVQFSHRWLAITTFVLAITLSLRVTHAGLRPIGLLLGGTALLQVGLGVATLLGGVPIALAAIHQANAILLLSALLATIFMSFKKEKPA